MHDFTALGIERDRRERLLEEARANRLRRSLREERPGLANRKLRAFAKELGRDARALVSTITGRKERKKNV
jgi:hypothetical protein